jgi:hypothetical protein
MLSFNVHMDNIFTIQPLLAELHRIRIGICGTSKQQFRGFPDEVKVEKNAKLPYHFRSGAANDGIAVLLWMDSWPVTMIATIQPLSGKDSLVL